MVIEYVLLGVGSALGILVLVCLATEMFMDWYRHRHEQREEQEDVLVPFFRQPTEPRQQGNESPAPFSTHQAGPLWSVQERYKSGERFFHDPARERVRALSDQEVSARYAEEMRKLKTLNRFGRHSERFLGYPNTQVMNLCQQECQRRGLPIPPVEIPGEEA